MNFIRFYYMTMIWAEFSVTLPIIFCSYNVYHISLYDNHWSPVFCHNAQLLTTVNYMAVIIPDDFIITPPLVPDKFSSDHMSLSDNTFYKVSPPHYILPIPLPQINKKPSPPSRTVCNTSVQITSWHDKWNSMNHQLCTSSQLRNTKVNMKNIQTNLQTG